MLKNYLLFSLIFTLIDMVYLTSAKDFFNKQVRSIQKSNLRLNLTSTLLCYIFLTVGIYYFAILKKMSIVDSGLLGLFVYGVFETTTHAIFKDWKWKTVIMDTVWGAILFSSSVLLYRKLVKYI